MWEDKTIEPKYRYDLAVYIGRFQPFHYGHMKVLSWAENLAERILLLVGSSNFERTLRNPWTFNERKKMIELAITTSKFSDNLINRVTIEPINDYPNDDTKWLKIVTTKILTFDIDIPKDRICVLGSKRDDSCYYLDMLDKFNYYNIEPIDISGTQVREMYFNENKIWGVTPAVEDYLRNFSKEKIYETNEPAFSFRNG